MFAIAFGLERHAAAFAFEYGLLPTAASAIVIVRQAGVESGTVLMLAGAYAIGKALAVLVRRRSAHSLPPLHLTLALMLGTPPCAHGDPAPHAHHRRVRTRSSRLCISLTRAVALARASVCVRYSQLLLIFAVLLTAHESAVLPIIAYYASTMHLASLVSTALIALPLLVIPAIAKKMRWGFELSQLLVLVSTRRHAFHTARHTAHHTARCH
jgi:hypothetical protein